MALSKVQVESLIQGLQRTDPRLHDTVKAMLSYIDTKVSEVEDQIIVLSSSITAVGVPVIAPTNFNYHLPGNQLLLEWDEITGAARYEVRVGADWGSSSFVVRTSSLAANLTPIVAGTYTYWLKAISSADIYGDATSLIVQIDNPSSVVITPVVIDNNVLLYWTEPVSKSFNISNYHVYQDSVLLGHLAGTFTTIFVNIGGTYNFSVVPVDIAGNIGTEAIVSVLVGQPPDFVLAGSILSTFAGTKTNCVLSSSILYAPIVTETYEEHFVDNSWASPAAQIAAGYPLFIQPGNINANYVEDFDFTSTFVSTLVNVSYSSDQFSSDLVTITCELKTSTDGISWSAATAGFSAFGTNVRYVRVKLIFTGATDKAICSVYNLKCNLDIKYAVDSGSVNALSTDATGTPVTFNKAFKDVNSITLTTNSIEPVTAIYDFVDIPNPTGFSIYIFDSRGTRISYPVSWAARGVV